MMDNDAFLSVIGRPNKAVRKKKKTKLPFALGEGGNLDSLNGGGEDKHKITNRINNTSLNRGPCK